MLWGIWGISIIADRRDKGQQDIIIDLKTMSMDIHDLQALVESSNTENAN